MKARWWHRYAATHPTHKVLRERPLPGQPEGDVYMMRWRLFHLGDWMNVYLHRVLRADNAPDAHDHPWPFWHYILEGGYIEWWWDRVNGGFYAGDRLPGWWAFHRAGYAHRIDRLYGRESWSLVIVGPRLREWGFIDRIRGCWVQWRAYVDGERC